MKARGPFGWPKGGLFKIGTQADIDAGTDSNAQVTAATLAAWARRGVVPPQGRLTLTTAVPVLTSDAAGQTTVFYTPSTAGVLCPIWDGSKWVNIPFTEVSQLTTDNTKSPAAVANNSNYDVFGWMDGTTFRATRGPAWTSDTARGTGAGTTELDFTQGIPRNKVAITNGPAAGYGTFLGTLRSNGSAQIDMKFGTAAANGGEARLCVWNCYNRRLLRANVQDSTATYTYATATIRAKHASNTNRISFIRGLDEDAVAAVMTQDAYADGTAYGTLWIGTGLDSTTAFSADCCVVAVMAANTSLNDVVGASPYVGYPGLGFHFLQSLERGDGTAVMTVAGASTFQRSGYVAQLWG